MHEFEHNRSVHLPNPMFNVIYQFLYKILTVDLALAHPLLLVLTLISILAWAIIFWVAS